MVVKPIRVIWNITLKYIFLNMKFSDHDLKKSKMLQYDFLYNDIKKEYKC